MPSELSNQAVRGSGGAAPGAGLNAEQPSQLIVLTFAEASQAEGLYDAWVDLDKQKLIDLKDAVFVSKNADGELELVEKVHKEKRKR